MLALSFSLRTTATRAEETRVSEALGDWQCEYTVPQPNEAGDYIVTYEYARSSAADVQAAAAALNRTAVHLAGSGSPFKATLVFARPLSIDEFTSFTRKVGIAPVTSIIRAVDPEKGGIIKLGAPAEYAQDAHGRFLIGIPKLGGKPIDTDGLARYTKGRKSLRILGVISTDVILDAATHENVQRDPRVYAVDDMEHVITDLVRKERPDVQAEHIRVRWSILYPAMEDTHIAPDPR